MEDYEPLLRSTAKLQQNPNFRSEISEEDSDDNTIQSKALPVSKKPLSPGAIPESGEQYLRLVRDENQGQPNITCASVNKGMRVLYSEANSSCPTWKYAFKTAAAASYTALDSNHVECRKLAVEEWKMAFMQSFTDIHKSMISLRIQIEGVECDILNDKSDNTNIINDQEFWFALCCNHRSKEEKNTLIRLLLTPQISSQPLLLELIDWQISWLKSTKLSECQAESLFYILAVIDRCLTADEMALIRQLAKQLITLRNQCSVEDVRIQWLNILITIVSQHFKQLDLI